MTILVLTLLYYCQGCSYIMLSIFAIGSFLYLLWFTKGENPLNIFKRWLLVRSISMSLKNRNPILSKPDPNGSMTKLILPTGDDEKIESKSNLPHSIAFLGVDVESGSSITLKQIFSESKFQKAKVFLQWNDKESNEVYTIENTSSDPWVDVEESATGQFVAGGLQLMVLEPMRRWRIVFNGMVRKQRNDELVHLRMSLIWSAVHLPFDWSRDICLKSVAKSFKGSQMEVEEISKLCENILPTGYDQWGSMFGEVLFSDDLEEKKVYMRGARQRRFGEEGDLIRSDFELVGVTENGFHFIIKQQSIKIANHSQNIILNYGHLLIPGCDFYPIVELADIPNFEWHQDLIRTQHFAVKQDFIKVNAGNRWFNIGIQMKPGIVKTDSESRRFQTHQIQSDLTFNCRRGRAICLSRTKLLENHHEFEIRNDLLKEASPQEIKPRDLVLALSNPVCTCSSLSGGKGSSLAMMINSKEDLDDQVKIPLGVCVTTLGFKKQLEDFPSLSRLIDEVEKCSSELNIAQTQVEKDEARAKLEDTCKLTIEAFTTSEVSSILSIALAKELDDVYSDNVWSNRKFAVRSSAVGEDSTELSSAGQNETFLGCIGQKNIENAILKCWASLFAFQSVEYRRQYGQPIKTGMGVVIQEMVPAEVAGVLFTRDPITGNPSKIIITANFGLGESVVSATSDPDTIVISNKFWLPENQLSVETLKVGSKGTRIDMVQDGTGTVEVSVDSSESQKVSVDEDLALRLSKVAIQLEKKFASPRDIEFAISNNVIYLLQSRPITSLAGWSDDDLLHEFDTGTFSKEDISTKANLGEVIPGASTPLTNSMMLNCLDATIQKMMLTVPGNQQAFVPYARRMINISHNHCFFNYLDCCLPQIESEEINAHIKAVDLAVFGHEVTTKEAIITAMDRRGLSTTLKKVLRLYSVVKTILKTTYWQKFGLPSYLKNPLFNLDQLKRLSHQHIYQAITKCSEEYEKACTVHTRVSEASTVFQLIIFMTLTENSPASTWSTDLFADAANLLASEGDEVVSAGCPTDMKILSDAIYDNQSEEKPFQSMVQDEAEKWLNNHPQISKLYQTFLQKFGHRCLREFELISKPWIEDRTPLISTLQAMVAAKSKTSQNRHIQSSETKNTIQQKLDSLQKPIKPGTKKALNFLLPLAHGAVALRENSKSSLIDQVHQVRMAYRELAKRLCRDGLLPDQELVFFMTHHEIGKLIETRTPSIIQKSIRRRRLRLIWDELRFKEMHHGVPLPFDFESASNKSFNAGLTVAHGTPVCRGKYKGVARVITRLADASKIRQGDILITISTDIGWSPYFPLLGGVATELGGLISHGAVVAREYGLPCVVGVEGATSIFIDGDQVEIDGAKGIITKC